MTDARFVARVDINQAYHATYGKRRIHRERRQEADKGTRPIGSEEGDEGCLASRDASKNDPLEGEASVTGIKTSRTQFTLDSLMKRKSFKNSCRSHSKVVQ